MVLKQLVIIVAKGQTTTSRSLEACFDSLELLADRYEQARTACVRLNTFEKTRETLPKSLLLTLWLRVCGKGFHKLCASFNNISHRIFGEEGETISIEVLT